jgi:hypothetical protein
MKLDSLPTAAQLEAENHTVEEVDHHLRYLCTMLKYGHKSNRKFCMKRVNHLLEIRYELTKDQ